MIPFLVGMSFAVAVTGVWYGNRAWNRIQRWGEQMQERESILHDAQVAEAPLQRKSPATAAAAVGSKVAVGLPH